MKKRYLCLMIAGSLLLLAGCNKNKNQSTAAAQETTTKQEVITLTMYYPVNIGGSAANLIDEICSDFNETHDNIYVEPVYTGNYDDTVIALKKAKANGEMPELFISLANQRFSLTSQDLVLPLDDLIAGDKDGKAYISDFLEGFMIDSYVDGKIYSIPFQRSTEIVYYNKDLFRAAGLDPENPPKTWDELANMAQKLTDFDHYGVGLALNPASAQWTFTGFCLQNSVNGENLMSDDGKKVFFNTEENVEALQFWLDLQNKYKCMERGVVQWRDLPVQFLNQKVAMIYHTTGNMTNVYENADFDFGVCYLPGKKRMATPTGGGNFYISSGISEQKKAAAWEFVKYCTSTEQAAKWSVNTGYVPVRKSCFETETMKAYYQKVPQAKVAYDQLMECVSGPELTTYDAENVWIALDDNIKAAVQGECTAKEAMDRAQAEAEELLKKYQ